MNLFLLLTLLLILPSVGYPNKLEVDFISIFPIEDQPLLLPRVREVFDVKTVNPFDYFYSRPPHDPNIVKIIVFEPCLHLGIAPTQLPKEKLILVHWEPQFFSQEFYDKYSRIYTWNDCLVDNVRFFRFNYPFLMPFEESILRFEEKKLCVMVVSDWAPKHRLDALKFFEAVDPGGLDCYGSCPPYLENLSMWKGRIPGFHSGKEKIFTLQKYRFCLCFENNIGFQGYITEKIFGCFAAGCVPIYWGAANIEKYIPTSCFIDYRDFQSIDEVYQYISTMPQDKHQEYVEEIKKFLQSEQAKIFSPEFFDNLIYEAITQ